MRKLIVALNAGVCVMALAPAAWAQTTPAAEDATIVTVTGSRVIRDGRNAPTPMTVETIEQLALTPTNIPEALNKLPQFAGSTNNVGAGNGSGSGRSNIFNGNFINLRSFGAIRTLILQDGRRVPATALNGQVDTNTIPQMLVERVDIVTGGASAVYGSDAVTGVVNFVLKKNYTGFKALVQTGITENGDGATQKIGLAGGFDILQRGHLTWSAEHFESDGIESTSDRDWSKTVPTYTGTGTASSPFVLVNNSRMSTVSDGGLATSGPFSGKQFASDGTLVAFNPGSPTSTAGVSIGGDGSYYQGVTMVPPLRTDQFFGRFDYDFNDSVSFYAQASYADAHTDDMHNSNERPNSYRIYSGNAFLTADEQALLTSGNTASFQLGRLNNDLSADASIDQRTQSTRFTTGLTGRVAGSYRWEAYYTYGQVNVDSLNHNNINYPHFFAALDAVKDTNGNTVCRVDLTNPGLYPGCVPINMFGTGNQSDAAKDYVYEDTAWAATRKMHDFGASISGTPFSTWAGPVSLSANVEYRQESQVETTTADALSVPDYTGIRTSSPPTLVWAYPTESAMRGSNRVWEVGSEILVPLLEGKPFAERLAVNAALRYTDYSTSGGATTWKLGAVYQPVTDIRFRGSISQDIRAPTLSDLFAGPSITFSRFIDPHTGVSSTVNVERTGNPDLVPEVAKTATVGFLYQPSQLPRFALSIDYYDVKIDNAIGTINGADASVLQECESSNGTSPVCASIIRPLPFSDTSPANYPTLILNGNLNLAQTYTRGVDMEASYNIKLADIVEKLPGKLDFRLLYTYQPILKARTFPNSSLVNYAGAVGLSKSRATLFVGYKANTFSATVQARYYSEQARSENEFLVFADPPLKSTVYADLNLTKDFKKYQVTFNISNMFNQDPRISPSTTRVGTPGTGNPAVAGDEVMGRTYTLALRYNY